MALVTPLLLLLLFGIIDFGRMLHAQITLTEAAREGARAAALHQSTALIERRVTDLTARLDPDNPPPPVVEAGCAGAGPTADAVVTVTHPFEPVTPLGPITQLFGHQETGVVTITAKGVMPCVG